MGANSSQTSQSTISFSSLLKRYEILSRNQEKFLTVVRAKQSSDTFIIKELGFVDKSFYERHLCRFNHFQERQQSQNALNLVKVWTEEHASLCSNTYKIFPMYEYSTVTLQDEINARKTENKHFEEEELLGMVQSFVNVLNSQPPILVSPSEYFISQDGLLKINNNDLFESEVLQTFTAGVYYSFEKMENFNESSFYHNDQNYLKQAVFSLGITLLSCMYLEDVSQKLYFPLHHNKRMRLSGDVLERLLNEVCSDGSKIKSNKFYSLIENMVHRDISRRPSLDQIQRELDQIVKLRQSRMQIDETQEKQEFDPEVKMANIEIETRQEKDQQNSMFQGEHLSTIQDNNKGLGTFKSKDLSDASELDILKEFPIGNKLHASGIHKQFQVPLVLSKNIQCQKIEPVSVTYEEFPQIVVEENLPSPICRQNPLFTNPQFLAKINEDIKQFSFKRKNSHASTEFSRTNSNLILVIQNHAVPLN